MAKVFIGVGHGGSDPGAVGIVHEANANLTIALEMKRILESYGFAVGISRIKDENDSLTEEIAECNAFGPELAVEVHNNAGGGDGWECYIQTNRYQDSSYKAASKIQNRVLQIGQNSRGIKTKKNSSGYDYFGWLREVRAPAVLCEGFFVDTVDAYDFDTEAELKKLGQAYAMGVLDFFGVQVGFIDVAPGAWFADAVEWAVSNGITNGIDSEHFGPEEVCTRGQALTFLWRAMGKPQGVFEYTPFDDVPPGAYYADAVAWAYSEGIAAGIDDRHFAPDDPCTRGQIVTFMWRTAGKPKATISNPFVDVPGDSYYLDPILWAVQEGITMGIDSEHFAPNDSCSRAQMVTFLHRMSLTV